MADEAPKGTKSQLAFALAHGGSVAAWARDNEVPKRTAYRWSKYANVRKTTENGKDTLTFSARTAATQSELTTPRHEAAATITSLLIYSLLSRRGIRCFGESHRLSARGPVYQ